LKPGSASGRHAEKLLRGTAASGAKLLYEVDPPKGSSRRKAAVVEISL